MNNKKTNINDEKFYNSFYKNWFELMNIKNKPIEFKIKKIEEKELSLPELHKKFRELFPDGFDLETGRHIWDIFSNNNVVCDLENNIYNLGSFRGTGSFLACHVQDKDNFNVDYLDFYMGTAGKYDEKIYSQIFEKMNKFGLKVCDGYGLKFFSKYSKI